jgi:wyosine [tRNA(Phe)-imidazoG37] synthetase (radical SAM superfamily)
VSLGINLLPVDGKLCSFDCIYCECGFNAQGRGKSKIPSRDEVKKALEDKLKKMKSEDQTPDVITFAGNGEPTIHPQFAGIIDDTLELRNQYFPAAKVSVLSNASMIDKPDVFDALNKVDNNILKLDSVDYDFICRVDRPQSGSFNLEKLIERLKRFNGKLIIQTMFIRGEYAGRVVDNTTPEQIDAWLKVVREINPESVMIYTIERDTPTKGLHKVGVEELNRIADNVRNAGLKVSVSG